jgi:glutathione S-transferase
MKLPGTNTSPYVRKVRLVLLEKNIPHSYLVDAPCEQDILPMPGEVLWFD